MFQERTSRWSSPAYSREAAASRQTLLPASRWTEVGADISCWPPPSTAIIISQSRLISTGRQNGPHFFVSLILYFILQQRQVRQIFFNPFYFLWSVFNWEKTMQCYLAAVTLELFTVWLSSNFPSQQCEAITEHLGPSFKQKSTFSTQLKQFAQLHYLCVQQILRIVKIFLPSFAQNFNFNLFEDLNTCTYTPVSAEQRWWQVISWSSYLAAKIFSYQKNILLPRSSWPGRR